MKTQLAAALLCLCACSAHAACTQSGQQCVHYKNGNVAGEGACTVTKCQDASGSSLKWQQKGGAAVAVETKNGKTTVNGKPGGQVKNGNAASMGLTCYAADANKNEQFCATSY